MNVRRLISLAGCLALLAGLLLARRPGATTTQSASAASLLAVPASFTDTLVTSVSRPTDMAFTPDGRIVVITQTGEVYVHSGGSNTLALSLVSQICSDIERGMLGVVVDPAFTTNRYIYLYYTFRKDNSCAYGDPLRPVNRLVRYTLSDANVASGATLLLDNIQAVNGNHNAGGLSFGKDGKLYIGVGDSGCLLTGGSCGGPNSNARRRDLLLGKVLRINKDGSVPSDNPWFAEAGSRRCGNPAGVPPGTGPCQEVWATGLRNPFRIPMDPNAAGTRFFINDVGQNIWEEISEGQRGADYGWNIREGFCANGSTTSCRNVPGATVGGLTDPLYQYNHSTGCTSITGGAFVPNGIWPAEYNNSYLYADYGCGRIFKLTPNGSGGYTSSDFATGLGGSTVTTLLFGPYNGTQALYYTTFAGQIRRVAYTGTANRPPVAVASANPTSGAAPLTVAFSSAGSSDPDGDAITYEWTFGDGTSSTSANPNHTYNSSGTFNATLRVRDSKGAFSAPVSVAIQSGNSAPAPSISAPAASYLFRAGETITLSGGASDAQDGALPASSLRWEVILHHGSHTHPFMAPASGNNLTFTAPAPEDLLAATNSYLEIKLTATDSQGLSTTISQNLNPLKVNVTVNTSPSGLRVTVNSSPLTGPSTFVSWAGYNLNVDAPAQTDGAGQGWTFQSWSDGGAKSHTIITPATAASYTASFIQSGTPTPTATRTNTPPGPTPTRTATTPPGGVNVALGRPVSGSLPINNVARVNDGDKISDNYAGLDLGPQWVQLDLGQSYSLNRIRLWHYFADGRTYRDVIVQLSNDASFATRTTVFNNDANNSAGQGAGADAEYAESSAGREISFAAVSARYIRLWTNGSSANGYNHYVEVEAFTP